MAGSRFFHRGFESQNEQGQKRVFFSYSVPPSGFPIVVEMLIDVQTRKWKTRSADADAKSRALAI